MNSFLQLQGPAKSAAKVKCDELQCDKNDGKWMMDLPADSQISSLVCRLALLQTTRLF